MAREESREQRMESTKRRAGSFSAATREDAVMSRRGHLMSYPRFLLRSLVLATDGSLAFYAWMTLLTAVFLVGANAWAHQVATGMILTNMTDHVSWGLYIANFTF